MNYENFEINMNRIKKAYGTAVPEERQSLVKARFVDLTDLEFARLIDSIIANEKSVPTMKGFMRYGQDILDEVRARKESEFLQQIERRRATKKACPSCNDDGSIEAIHKTNRHVGAYALACPEAGCLARDYWCKNLPQWGVDFAEFLTPVFYSEGLTSHQVWCRVHGEPGMAPVRPSLEWNELLKKIKGGAFAADKDLEAST